MTCKKNNSERGDVHYNYIFLFNVSKHVTCCKIFNSITFELNNNMELGQMWCNIHVLVNDFIHLYKKYLEIKIIVKLI